MGSHPKLQCLISEPPDEPVAYRVPGSPLLDPLHHWPTAGYFYPPIRPTNSESLHPPSLTATNTTASRVQSPCRTSTFCHSNPGQFGEAAGKAVPVGGGAEDMFAAVAPVDDRLIAVGHPHEKRSSHARFLPISWLLSMLRM